MTDIASLPSLTSVTDSTSVLTSDGKLLSYQTIRDKVVSDLISDSLGTPSDSKSLSQVGAQTLLSSKLSINNNLGDLPGVASARDNLRLEGNKNAIINGDFNVWQRGTSFVSIANTGYSADRWSYYKAGTMIHDISRSSDVPSVAQASRLYNYSLLVDCQTIDSSIASTDYCVLQQRIEGYNWLRLAQKVITLSFWVKATKIGTYCVSLGNASPFDRSIVKEFIINASDTWENKTLTFPASPSAGTWDYTNGIGLRVSFCLAAGSTYQSTADSWQTGNFHATSNQVNACDNITNNFRICGVQLEAGSIATPFENRDIQRVISLCQRYYEKSYNVDVTAAAVTDVGQSAWFVTSGFAGTFTIPFKLAKRANPSIVIYGPTTGNTGVIFQSPSTERAAAVTGIGTGGFNIYATSNFTATVTVYAHWTANSEL